MSRAFGDLGRHLDRCRRCARCKFTRCRFTRCRFTRCRFTRCRFARCRFARCGHRRECWRCRFGRRGFEHFRCHRLRFARCRGRSHKNAGFRLGLRRGRSRGHGGRAGNAPESG
ncbi:pentapeptide repeat-containing protein [Mycetocola saprophilus]|uniref:pentapeptide repeat-containing protein n=1 Tax=Mycetocola saprophilus TaxID=76636 RepID=UPI003BF23995